MESTSELVWLYVKRRPFLKEILREKVVNFSSLARKISLEAFGSKKRSPAVKMALVRLAARMQQKGENLEGRIFKVLKDSSLSIKSKIAIVISTKRLDAKYLSCVESNGSLTYIMEEKELEKLRRQKAVIKLERNLSLISIHSSPSLEETPGVVAHLLNSLADEGINVLEFISCYTDTLLVVRAPDTTRTYEVLGNLLG
ncbi:ACT domain-containing protein [Candidatus Micrarchaeota archaeon]|nr:ACT domain-containing protein [Candidatus Micrarchaeota archaeon]